MATIDARALAHRLRSAALVLRSPTWAPPGHFYSPLSSKEDVSRAEQWRTLDEVAGVDLNEAEQLAELPSPWPDIPSPLYHQENSQYGAADAVVLSAMLERIRPQRIIEVGSGFSTAAMLDTIDRCSLDTHITCIEPYPQRLLDQVGEHSQLDLLIRGVQDVSVETFTSLAAGDVLFIDSTHVLKPGSDVAWLYLHVLPRLAKGVIVHIHDIFWPFEYPTLWLTQHRDWTELYLLRALLAGTDQWKIMLFANWLWATHPDLVPESLRHLQPGAIWMLKTS